MTARFAKAPLMDRQHRPEVVEKGQLLLMRVAN
jgi:hypothetical protein